MRLAEVQFVHWAAIRPDPIPLAMGVNQVLGPNGAGKTAFLDGVKLLYGVDEVGGDHHLRGYVYRGGPELANGDPPVPADQAYLRGTFHNPPADRGHRLFAVFGQGCDHADFVTVFCVVRRLGTPLRSYLVVPGWESLGRHRPIEDDLRRWSQQPRARWLGGDVYGERLSEIGISRTHRRILALPQGETAQLLRDPPERLFNRVLELTGKQAVLDEFRRAQDAYQKAEARYQLAQQQLGVAEARLAKLELRAQRHQDFQQAAAELRQLEHVLLPAARYRDKRERLRNEMAALDGVKARLQATTTERQRLADNAPLLHTRMRRLSAYLERLEGQAEETEEAASQATRRLGSLNQQTDRLGRDIEQAAAAAAGEDPVHWRRIASDATAEHALALEAFQQLDRVVGELREEAHSLRDGRAVPPTGLAAFLVGLAERGIRATVVADEVDLPPGAPDDQHRRLAETALGDALWAIVVPPDRLEEATALAVAVGHRLPIAPEGPGRPQAALAGLLAPQQLGGLLEDRDAVHSPGPLPAMTAGVGQGALVTAEGVRHDGMLARYTAPPRPVLGQAARAARLADVQAQLHELQPQLAAREKAVAEAAGRVAAAEAGVAAAQALPGLTGTMHDLTSQLTQLAATEQALRDRNRTLHRRAVAISKRAGDLQRRSLEEDQRRQSLAGLEAQLIPQLEVATRSVEQLQRDLAAIELTGPQRAALDGDLGQLAVLESQRQRLAGDLEDPQRYPPEVRDELVVAQRDEEAAAVEAAHSLLDDRYLAEVTTQQRLVEQASTTYEANVVSTIGLLDDQFRILCAQASMEGSLRRITLDGRAGLDALDMLVSHHRGERPVSYRDTGHSGGQRVKMAILLLLATLRVSGAADFLILDEPTAHLDQTNTLLVGQLMRSLAADVQFLLATPTSGDEHRVARWCDVVIGLAARTPGDSHNPPAQLLVAEHALLPTPPDLPLAMAAPGT
jgi:chromosome segregation ATPase